MVFLSPDTSVVSPQTVDAVLHRTITNYAPDGRLHSADLIDTVNEQDYVDHYYYGIQGRKPSVLIRAKRHRWSKPCFLATTGTRGIFTSDDADTFGVKTLPAGHYQIGVTVAFLAAGVVTRIGRLSVTPSLSASIDFAETIPVQLLTDPRRYVINAFISTPRSIDVSLKIAEIDYPDGAAVPQGPTCTWVSDDLLRRGVRLPRR